MSRIKTFLIGRQSSCDITLDDNSVSRQHAEVVLTADGGYYIADRNSTGGTFVYRDSAWLPIQQASIKSTDRLRFGKHEIPASRLEYLRTLSSNGNAKVAAHGTREIQNDGLDPSKGLMFDPETGDVIEQSK